MTIIHYPLSGRKLLFILLLASALNVLPMVLDRIGSDIVFQLVIIRCFAEQFWQGDLTPHWCMSADAGLGAPLFLFYFPFPLYVSSLMYPVTWLGVNLYWVYVASCFFATLVTGYTAWYWLRAIVSPTVALWSAILLLFMPYRMEVMFFRAGYSELWSMAWLPLVFHFLRQIIRTGKGSAGFASGLALICLSHIACAIIAALFAGFYAVSMAGKQWRKLLKLALAGCWGLAIAAFYIVPALYYRQFISGNGVIAGARSWPNTYLSAANMSGQLHPVIAICFTLLMFVLLAARALRIRNRLEPAMQRELYVMMALFLLAAFFLLPVSRLAYRFTSPLSDVVLPWRMQGIFVMAMTYLLAIQSNRQKRYKTELTALLLMLALMGQFLFSAQSTSPQASAYVARMQKLYYIAPPEYGTRWTGNSYHSLEYLTQYRQSDESLAKVRIIKGDGHIELRKWNWDGITIKTASVSGMQLRLAQRYFPLWHIDPANKAGKLSVEPDSGQMLLNVPAGISTITIRCDYGSMSYLIAISQLISLLSALAIMSEYRFKKTTRNHDINPDPRLAASLY